MDHGGHLTLRDRAIELHAQQPELSQADIARELGTTRQYVYRVLKAAAAPQEPKRMGPPLKPRCEHCGAILKTA